MDDIFEKAQTVMDEIAADPKYGGEVTAPDWLMTVIEDVRQFLNRLGEEIGKIIQKIVEFLAGLFPDSGMNEVSREGLWTFFTVLLIVIGAAILILITIIIVKIIKKRGKAEADDANINTEAQSFGKDYNAPYEIAKSMREKGDLKMSLRYLFIAALVRFAADEIILLHKAKTNRMYLTEIENRSKSIKDTTLPLFDSFNECWYGRKKLEDNDIELLFSVYDRVDNAVRKYSASKNREEDAERS